MTVRKMELRPRQPRVHVAAYIRVSSDLEKQLDSLDNQKQHYETVINSNPEWTSAGLFIDEGISGTGENARPGLQSLMDQCREGKIQLILTKSISRFARNTTACLEMVRELSALGVTIVFEKEEIDTSRMESELLLSILSAIAEAESASISDNLKWGIRKRFQDGTYKAISTPYGYRWDGEKIVPDPKEAPVVRRMYSEFLGGKSLSSICRGLDRDGIRPRKGGEKWSSKSVKDILQNEKYTGRLVLQKTYTDDKFKRHPNLGQLPSFVIDNNHEPIVSEEMFRAASALLFLHTDGEKGLYQNRYAFSGRIVCGKCGSLWKRQRRSDMVYWACRGHLDHCKCEMMPIRDDFLKIAFCTMWNRLHFGAAKVLKPYVEATEGTIYFRAADSLYRTVKGSPPLREFSDELFAQHVDRIRVVSQCAIVFEMKCGLKLRERLSYRQPHQMLDNTPMA